MDLGCSVAVAVKVRPARSWRADWGGELAAHARRIRSPNSEFFGDSAQSESINRRGVACMALVAGDLQSAVFFAAFAARAQHARDATARRLVGALGEPTAGAAAGRLFVAVPARGADAAATQAARAVVAARAFGFLRSRAA